MSKLHVTQIAGYLQKNLSGKVDVSDYQKHKNPEDREKVFLTRALAALSISHLTGRPIDEFPNYITDGAYDGRIDLIYFHEKEKTLYLVQSKWHDDGNGSISHGDMLKFLSGVKKIIDLDMDGLNERVKSRYNDVKNDLYDADARIVLVIAYTGSEGLHETLQREIQKYIEDQNDTSEVMSIEILGQSTMHKAVSAGISGNPIDIDVQLLNWGRVQEPYKAVYGRVYASDVANWYRVHGSRLFEKNLRQFLPSSTVNQDLVSTLINSPAEFWYFNNGITAISRSVEKKPLGGNQTDTGIWECKGFSVVNGAQTVGSIHGAFTVDPDKPANATVSVRIIEISEESESFGLDVTKNTNRQNSVEKKDFVALDPQQERIRQELKFDNIDYIYKSGAAKTGAENCFDLTEATIAIACCNSDPTYAVQAKREISKLWEDIERPPYRALFNAGISGPQIWNLVRILRKVEAELSENQKEMSGRDALVCVHGNRFIQWASFQRLSVGKNSSYSDVSGRINLVVEKTVADVIVSIRNGYSESYPASLFKNMTKCKSLALEVCPPAP